MRRCTERIRWMHGMNTIHSCIFTLGKLPFPSFGKVDAAQHQCYTKQCHEADRLVQKEHGAYEGEEGVEVEVVGRADGS